MTMQETTHHSPLDGEDLIAAYAAGNLDEAKSLLVATHLALNPEARRAAADYEALGGVLLEDMEPVEMAPDALDAVLARLDEAETLPDAAGEARPRPDLAVPRPLRDYLEGSLDQLRWHRLLPGVAEYEIESLKGGDERVCLLRVAPGKAVPSHSHRGEELTLVLTGAFRDASGRFGPGDLQVCDESVDHKPIAEPGEECICLVVTEAPLRLTGRFGRLLNPLIYHR